MVRPSHFFFFYSTYQWKAYRVEHPPSQVHRICIPSYPPSSPSCLPLFLLFRLKSRYPAASCAFGHRLLLTSYMLSSKVICDDTYSNKVSVSLKKIAFAPTTYF